MKNIFIIILFAKLVFAANVEIWNTKLLFCLNKNIPTLEISNDKKSTNIDELNTFLDKSNINSIEVWLPGATDEDYQGDIYLNRIYRLHFDHKEKNDLTALIENLKKLSFIHSAEFEYKRKPLYTPNDQYYNNQWFLPAINANDAWDLWNINNGETPGNKNIILASVDLGVTFSHPDLRNNIWQNLGEDADGDGRTIEGSGSNWYLDPGDLNGIDDDDWDNNGLTYIDDLIGWDPAGLGGIDDNNPAPPNSGSWSHGTHVAGLLSATTNNYTGIASAAFDCSIMAVKVSDENQSGNIYITDGFAGILYAAKAGYYAEGFSIINNSWGGGGYSMYEQAVVTECHDDYNAIIVCAAGNGSTTSWGESDEAHYPSGYEDVISVCALGSNNQWNHWATYGSTVDLASPGENIRSTTNSGYSSWDGSSMASPVAASVFGLLKSLNPTWNNEMLEMMVLSTADPVIYNVNQENYLQGKLGRGRVDALNALVTPLFPKIEYVGEDLIAGNDNIISPGEEVELFIILFNDPEWGEAVNLQANLTTNSQYVSILNSNAFYGDIPPGEAMIIEPFIFSINSNAPETTIQFELSLSSNEDGYIEYINTIPLSYQISAPSYNLGDINADETINVLDIVILVNIIIGTQSPSEMEQLSADMNEDGMINVQDIVLLVNSVIN